ncbi:MAG: hypothetical protein ACR2JB_27145 [Bryobacteraceae bacterium]
MPEASAIESVHGKLQWQHGKSQGRGIPIFTASSLIARAYA